MGKRRRRTATERMVDAVTGADARAEKGRESKLPAAFLAGLRGALDGGLSSEQLTAFVILARGVCEASEILEPDELVERAEFVSRMMEADIREIAIDRTSRERWRSKGRKKFG